MIGNVEALDFKSSKYAPYLGGQEPTMRIRNESPDTFTSSPSAMTLSSPLFGMIKPKYRISSRLRLLDPSNVLMLLVMGITQLTLEIQGTHLMAN
jgi:hypothetical protein